jgi:hypothetical protein
MLFWDSALQPPRICSAQDGFMTSNQQATAVTRGELSGRIECRELSPKL